MKKELKYQIICVVVFLIAIGISIIARHGQQPLPGDFSSDAAGFQVTMGALFGLCLNVIFLVAGLRMYRLAQQRTE